MVNGISRVGMFIAKSVEALHLVDPALRTSSPYAAMVVRDPRGRFVGSVTRLTPRDHDTYSMQAFGPRRTVGPGYYTLDLVVRPGETLNLRMNSKIRSAVRWGAVRAGTAAVTWNDRLNSLPVEFEHETRAAVPRGTSVAILVAGIRGRVSVDIEASVCLSTSDYCANRDEKRASTQGIGNTAAAAVSSTYHGDQIGDHRFAILKTASRAISSTGHALIILLR